MNDAGLNHAKFTRRIASRKTRGLRPVRTEDDSDEEFIAYQKQEADSAVVTAADRLRVLANRVECAELLDRLSLN